MRCTLPNGKQAKITVIYDYKPKEGEDPVPKRKLLRDKNLDQQLVAGYRFTLVHIKLDEESFSGYSSCSPSDKFSKYIARKSALADLFQANKDKFDEPNRLALWAKICSKYVTAPKE